MPSLTVRGRIRRPRSEVYAFLADVTTRPHLYGSNFTDFRVVSDSAIGAGAAFRYVLHFGEGEEVETRVQVAEAEPSRRLIEDADDGYVRYRTTWELADAAEELGSTAVNLRLDYQPSGGRAGLLLDWLFGRRALKQTYLVELARLKLALEGGRPA